MEDISAMTGLSINTLSAIENGGDTFLSSFIRICQALGKHPREVVDVEVSLVPNFPLPPRRKDRNLTTARVRELYDSGYFKEPRIVSSVVEEFQSSYGVQPLSSELSTALKKLHLRGELDISKKGRRNVYVMRKSEQKS